VAPWPARLERAALAATAPQTLATVRTGIGVVMLLTPQVLPQLLGVDAAARARTSWAVQMVGAREVALGAGVLAAQRSGGARPWLLAGSACDVVDAVVIGAAARRGAVDRPLGAAIALSALVAGLVTAARR
jgi:peptide-methionine (R)-S-oxide reductase